MPTVRIPPTLRTATGGAREVEASGGTVHVFTACSMLRRVSRTLRTAGTCARAAEGPPLAAPTAWTRSSRARFDSRSSVMTCVT